MSHENRLPDATGGDVIWGRVHTRRLAHHSERLLDILLDHFIGLRDIEIRASNNC
jgi:hypothetical protein